MSDRMMVATATFTVETEDGLETYTRGVTRCREDALPEGLEHCFEYVPAGSVGARSRSVARVMLADGRLVAWEER